MGKGPKEDARTLPIANGAMVEFACLGWLAAQLLAYSHERKLTLRVKSYMRGGFRSGP